MRRVSVLRLWAAATEPRRGAVDRLRARLTGLDSAPLLREVAHVDERAVHRLQERLRAGLPLRPRPLVSRSWPVRAARVAGRPVVLAVASLAAAAVLIVLWPGSLDERLSASVRTERALTSAVHVAFQGSGSATGPRSAPRVHWEVGTLQVEVDPTAGIDLVVDTPEATVRVVGTGFAVKRDALGTAIEVRHGAVAVDCGDGWAGTLRTSETHTCLPLTASGWLLRVRALQDAGASVAVVLDGAARGIALATPEDPIGAELINTQVEVLLSAGRTDEARDAARAYPPDGPRAAELSRFFQSLNTTP